MKSTLLIAAAASICLATGCASDTGDGATSEPAIASTGLTVPTAVPPGMRVLVWNLIRVAGRDIRVSVSKTGCTVPRGFAVVASKDAVVITAYGKRAAGFCTSEMTTVIQTLVLSDPLGTRHLVHQA